MLRTNLFKLFGVSAITFSAAIMPLTLPAAAQITQPGVEGPYERRTEVYDLDDDDDNFSWGWLGLLGLLGLAGLGGKKRQQPTAYREPDAVGRSGYRE